MHRFIAPIAILLVLAACGGKPPADAGHGGQPPPPPTVGVAQPIVRSLPDTRDFTGHLEPIAMVELRPLVGGTIAEVLVADGAAVVAGQPLFRIDQQPLLAVRARAEAEVARAEAMLAQAKQHRDRAERLLVERVLSQQDFDDAASALTAATAGLASAQAGLQVAQLDVGYADVIAPITGRLGRILATKGNIAQGSGPAPGTHLATIVSTDPVYAVFDLDETTWQSIGPRLSASASGGEVVPVRLGLAGERDFPHEGVVTFVDNHIDSASGSIRIRATVPNADGALVPGAFARIRIEIAAPHPVILIHERVVQSQLNTRYVLTVDDTGATAFRPLALGGTVGPMRIVLGGLGTDERIAINNLSKIFYPGMPVTPVPASMETLENLAQPGQAASPGQAGKPASDESVK